ncbi:hypothetical protein EDD15DRAFT_1905266 [Pisolithus albus]|nr:hypothetical protein EDD15DRAFT_1905266 [Pisolithus albus]
MGSLSSARAQLAYLQRRELQLLQELSDVRKALTAQKAVLDEFVKASAVPYIDRLPNELLAEIFLLLIDERRRLVSVSRRWRAVICDTGKMWGEIDLEYDSPTMQKLCLERSRDAPLTLTIREPRPLDVFLPHANRWHTLSVLHCTEGTLRTVSQIMLPSLRHLVLEGTWLRLHDVPTMRSWAPALKHLELINWKPPLSFRLLCQIVPAESLEELELSITRHDGWKLEKDSMHLPSLRRLALEMRDPISFLEAIVAPELASFCFTASDDKGSISNTFAGNTTKFSNVSHLTLSCRRDPDDQTLGLIKLLCQVFCGIRHARIKVHYVRTMSPRWGKGAIDQYCTCIESLEIQGIILDLTEPYEDLVYWFEKRTRFGQRKLHLKLTAFPRMAKLMTLYTSHTVFQRLHECCASVVLVGFPGSPQLYLPTSAGSLLSSSPTYSVVNVVV